MGVLDEIGGLFRRQPSQPRWPQPPDLPPVQQPPAALDPMRIDPVDRYVARNQFLHQMRKERPYGRGYDETQVQPGGETDPYSLKTMNRMVGGRGSGKMEDRDASHYANINTDAGRGLPWEYQPWPQDAAPLAQLLQNLRPQFPVPPPLPPRRPRGY